MRYIALVVLCVFLTGCLISDEGENNRILSLPAFPRTAAETAAPDSIKEHVSFINPDGVVIKERFLLPEGFSRVETEDGSFAEFLQELPLKPDGSAVKYFDGREKAHGVYMAVVDYSLGDRDLQQCADSVMRLRAEYLYANGRLDEIHFNFVNGFTAYFTKWADGYGVSVNGNRVSWVDDNRNDASYESFQRYLNIVYAYAGTLSLAEELIPKDISGIEIGDVFIEGGSPGHCVIIVDMAINESTDEKVFMLAQGFMPAQDIQILECNEEGTPWYSADISATVVTPEWIFDMTQLKTWP